MRGYHFDSTEDVTANQKTHYFFLDERTQAWLMNNLRYHVLSIQKKRKKKEQ